MRFYLASLAYLAAAAVVAGQSTALTINTPLKVVECEPLLIPWSGGKAPYSLEGFVTRVSFLELSEHFHTNPLSSPSAMI
ncbi:hypothetical protein V8E55_010933 [Tylopilus felleus]